MNLRQLQEKRASIVANMRTLTSAPTGVGGDLSEDQASQFDLMKDELMNLEKNIERAATLADAERRMTGTPVNGGDNFESRATQASLSKIIAAAAGERIDIGLETECSQEIERRTGVKAQGLYFPMESRVMTSTSPVAGPGGTIIPTDYRPQDFIDRLRNKLVIEQAGAVTMTGLSGNITIPGLQSSVTTGWVAENTALAYSDQAYRSITLSPKHCGVITEFSRNMILQSSPDVENLLRQDMASQLAEALDLAALNGSGGVEPTGLLNMAGLAKVTTGGTLNYDALVDLAALPEQANSGGGAYVTNSKIKADLLKIKTVDGLPLGLATLFGGNPYHIGNTVPDGTVIFGNWADLLIGVWSGLDILVNPYESTAFTKGNVTVRAMMTIDIAVRHLPSFAAITDA